MVLKVSELRPLGVAYLWAVGAGLILTGTTALHPVFGRAWDVLALAGALACILLPFVAHARARSVLVAAVAFVCLIHAEEWVRLSRASPVGLSVAALWVAAIIGVVATVTTDQERTIRSKLEP